MKTAEETIEEVSRRYDKAYCEAQTLFDEYNPCQIRLNGDGLAVCIVKEISGALCCIDCYYHSYDGCTVVCLGCKISLCGAAGDHEELRHKLEKIRQSLPKYRLTLIRRSKETVMEEVTKILQRRKKRVLCIKKG